MCNTFLADIRASISSKNITEGCRVRARLKTAFINFSPENVTKERKKASKKERKKERKKESKKERKKERKERKERKKEIKKERKKER